MTSQDIKIALEMMGATVHATKRHYVVSYKNNIKILRRSEIANIDQAINYINKLEWSILNGS